MVITVIPRVVAILTSFGLHNVHFDGLRHLVLSH